MFTRNFIRVILFPLIFVFALLSASSASKSRPVAITSQPANSGAIIQYTSFGGAVYQLHAYDGRYVRYALPDTWIGPGGLSPDEINQLVNLTDLVYAHLKEIVAGEPAGSGLVTVAVVPTSASDGGSLDGQGLGGAKGVEISPTQLTNVKTHLDSEQLTETVIHEMAHNFDLYNHYLSYYADWRHAWTTFLIPYLQFYMRTGSLSLEPDDLINVTIDNDTFNWDQLGANASWEKCVRDQSCQGVVANEAWAGFLLRYARLHGPNVILRAFSYLSSYKASHPTPPATAEGQNDLLVRALAEGAQVNIGCEIDVWRWSASADMRNQIAMAFPGTDSLCLDSDGDGFSPLAGDLNDADGNVRPGAVETANGIDDDCDGIVDDLLLKETDDFPAQVSDSSPSTKIPARIMGMAEAGGKDSIRILATKPELIKVKLRNRGGFHGWISFGTRDGQSAPQSFYSLAVPEATFAVDHPGEWVLTLEPDAGLTSGDPGGAGNYDLTIEEAGGPQTDSVTITQTVTNGTFHITATVSPEALARNTMIRFWASGEGFISTQPIAQSVSFDWTPAVQQSAVAIQSQLLAGSVPTTRPTAPRWVSETSGTNLGLKTDLSLIPRSLPPSQINYDQQPVFGFELVNNGPVAADNVSVQLTLDPTLKINQAIASRGLFQSTGASATTLQVGRVSEGERILFCVTASALSASGDTTSSFHAASATDDLQPADNNYSAHLNITGQVLYYVQPLPLRTGAPTAAAKASAAGGISRAIVPLPNLVLAALFAQPDSSGNWPVQGLGGVNVTIGGQTALVLAVTPASDPSFSTNSYSVDFVIPEGAPLGTAIPVNISYQPLNLSWSTTTEIRESAPALWAADGTAAGNALAQEADTFIVINSPHPAAAGDRVAIYASGIRKLAAAGTLSLIGSTPGGQTILLTIDYAGPQQRFPGLDQLNFMIPNSLSGAGTLTIKLGGIDYTQVSLPVK